jgi:cytochrome c553
MRLAARLGRNTGLARCALGLVSIGIGLSAGELRAEPPKASEPPAWNAPQAEKLEALEREGQPEQGRRLYEACASCHLANGAGQPDGTMPQLAGQHRTVLIKQLAEIRSGLRANPVMLPFAQQLAGPQDLADVAAYLAALPVPAQSGSGPGVELDRGQALYQKDCARCHGAEGEGLAESFYPRLAGQHYRYVVRQVIDIASGRRGNAHPEMVRVLEGYSAGDVSRVADYVSRLRR